MEYLAISWENLIPDLSVPFINGGMSIVFKAEWTMKGGARQQVAVKVLKLANVEGVESLAEKLTKEAAIISAAIHGGAKYNVVPLFGLAQGPTTESWIKALGFQVGLVLPPSPLPPQLYGMVMSWESGGTLYDLLHKRGVWGASTGERVAFCARLALGLSVLHSNDLIHGDIKGENVLLDNCGPTPIPKFADFGISQLRTGSATSFTSQAIASEKEKGTWQYMAPEMYRSSDSKPALAASRSSDVYALGTLCWEVLTGTKPWAGYTETSRVLAIHKGEVLSFNSPPLPPDLPPLVKEALLACLAFAKESRPRVSKVADDLLAASQILCSNEFDVFLSHKWLKNEHDPITSEVYKGLIDSGLRVWIDKEEMGNDMDISMEGGIARSKCVLALVNSRYQDGDPAKNNCLKELAWAQKHDKPIVACRTDSDPNFFPSGPLAEFLDRKFLPSLSVHVAVDWKTEGEESSARSFFRKGDLSRIVNHIRPFLGKDDIVVDSGFFKETNKSSIIVDPTSTCGYAWGIYHWNLLTLPQRKNELELYTWEIRTITAKASVEQDTLDLPTWCSRFYHSMEINNFPGCQTYQDLIVSLEPYVRVGSTAIARGDVLPWEHGKRFIEDITGTHGHFTDSRVSRAALQEWFICQAVPLIAPLHDSLLCRVCLRAVNSASDLYLGLVQPLINAGASVDALNRDQKEFSLTPIVAVRNTMAKLSPDPKAVAGRGFDGKRFVKASSLVKLLLDNGARD